FRVCARDRNAVPRQLACNPRGLVGSVAVPRLGHRPCGACADCVWQNPQFCHSLAAAKDQTAQGSHVGPTRPRCAGRQARAEGAQAEGSSRGARAEGGVEPEPPPRPPARVERLLRSHGLADQATLTTNAGTTRNICPPSPPSTDYAKPGG